MTSPSRQSRLLFARHDAVALAEINGLVRIEGAAGFRLMERFDDVGVFEIAEANRHMPKTFTQSFNVICLFGTYARLRRKLHCERDRLFIKGSHLACMIGDQGRDSASSIASERLPGRGFVQSCARGLPDELGNGDLISLAPATHGVDAGAPSRHNDEDSRTDHEWYPAAIGNLREISEECDIDAYEQRKDRDRAPSGPSPRYPHDFIENGSRHQHGG